MKLRKRAKEKKQNQKAEMGGCIEWPQRNGFRPNGLVVEEDASVTRPLDPVRWAKAEESTAELISRIQPNRLSEKHRKAVASYVKRLISTCLPCEVFTFGSVPLKTYLPDGDIDLTTFSEDRNLKDNWAKEVQDMLQKEEKNEHAEFSVKEVQLIEAEVKLIKCLVDNIVVDISFNQLGGLCTLCFLEEVDNLISQNHLFKRSIILIKAWCYYESRVLGAHHGLISTYALETLVLYIFHVFNNSFAGPLEVLYRFLEFFSKFDWANFCVSLWGPVPISSLPSMAAAPPRKDGGDLLLSQKFLEACGSAYSVVHPGPDNRGTPFMSKHFNVIDPLRLNNNLGRSVSKGNFYRIRSAFSLGAQQLAKLLQCPVEDIVPELNQFFVNTWDRHGNGCRPDAHSELDFDESRHSLGYSGQPVAFPLLPTARTPDSQTDMSALKQKGHDESRNHMASSVDHYYTERNNLWKKQRDDIKRTCRMNILQASGHTTHQFARTSSSPELTSMSSESASRRNVAPLKVGDDVSSRPGYSRRLMDSGTRENHVANRFTDEPSMSESSPRHSLAFGSEHSFDSCVSNSVCSSTTPVGSAHESRQTCEEEQDFLKKLSSTGIQHHGGHAQMPVNLASHSFIPFPPSIMGYSHQNYAGMIPTNLSALESDWGTMMNYSNGPFSAPFHQPFRPFRVIAEQDKMIGGLNDRAVSPEVDHVDEHSGFWIDRNDHSNREIEHESEDFSTASSRLLPASPSASSRTKALSESSWDGKPAKTTNLSRYPVVKKVSSTRNSGATVNSKWEEDGQPVDHTRDDVNADHKDWVHFSAPESIAQAVTTSPVEVNQIPGFGQQQMSCQNSMSPFGSLLVHPGPNQGVVHNHAVLPVAFYPGGSHMPFVTMVPVYNMPAEAGSSGVPIRRNDMENGKPPYPVNQSGCSTDPAHKQEQLRHTDYNDSKNVVASGEQSDDCGSDIFNSDFANHWKNLQYGRHCQGTQVNHPFVYHSSVLVPPLPPQGTSSMVTAGMSNTFAHVVPVPVPQSGSVKPAGVSRRYGGEISKQRNGTGTYFPNPNMIKERQYFTHRHYRGDYGHDRNENHEEREANWNHNSKPRYNGRAQPRNYYEKQNMKIDRSSTSISQTDRTWDTNQPNSKPFYSLSKGPSSSNPTQYVPDNVDSSVLGLKKRVSGGPGA